MRKYVFLLWLAGVLPCRADTYVRQPGVDVVHYEIRLELSDATDSIFATARVHVLLRRAGLSTIWLDFAGMDVDGVSVDAKDRPFTMRDGRLEFDLGFRSEESRLIIVEVRYHGAPGDRGLLIGRNAHGRRVFFAENWPDHARYWFPSIDHPSDKATVEFAVTAPEKYDVVANGRLVETRSLLDGRRLTRWSEGLPIPTYCMVFGAAEFSIVHAGSAGDVPVTFYAYPEDAAAAARKFARTKLVMSYFSDLVGPYPYEKLAQVESTTRIGGMENSSAIFYAERSFQGETVREGPVPHEIAHQWFGDSVTAADWDHLWLSEGFATYLDALFYEHLEGPEALRSRMARAAEAVKKYHEQRPAALIDPELTDLMKKLNAFNYQKGAWVLHMLRKSLGDERFFQGIRRYYSMYAGKTALSHDFQEVMEAAGGVSLETFFRQWLHQPGWPEYEFTWRWDEAASEVEVVIRQVQPGGLFDTTLDIAVMTGGRTALHPARVSERVDTFRFPARERPNAIQLDPGDWLLKTVVGKWN